MRYPAKLFGLVTLIALMMTVRQIPGLAQHTEGREQVQDKEALAQREIAEDLKAEADQLYDEAFQLGQTSQYQSAWDKLQQALELYRHPSVRQAFPQASQQGEAKVFSGLGFVLNGLGQYRKSLDLYEVALAIQQTIHDPLGEAKTLVGIGEALTHLSHYDQALNNFQNALSIYQDNGSSQGIGEAFLGMGRAYVYFGQYEQALTYFQDALAISKDIGDRRGEGTALNSIGGVYRHLGQHEQALSYHQDALVIRQNIDDLSGQGDTLNNLGAVYYYLGQNRKALQHFQAALIIHRNIGNRNTESMILNNLGELYRDLGQYEQALNYSEMALAICQDIGERRGEGTALNNIGGVYYYLGQHEQALNYFQSSLIILQGIGDRSTRGITLGNIGYLLDVIGEPELAIVFLKQSINQYEAIRGDIRGLSIEDQKAFADSIAETYRHLADLLFQQDRILEAQRVLDLLKVQELDDYLQDVQRNGNTEQGVVNRPPEAAIETNFSAQINQVIELNREIDELESLDQLTPAQQNRLIELGQQHLQLIEAFNTFWDSPNVQEQVALLRNTTSGESIDFSNYRDLQDNLAALQQHAVLLYPFVLEDRLELVLVAPELDIPIRKTVPIKRVELNEAIANYRSALQDPRSNPLPLAQQLYQWLLKPLRNELNAIGAETIIYAPDAQLRYIPLAALHDGEQWIAQRFTVNNITAASLTDLAQQPHQDPRVFAAAVTEGSYPVTIGDQQVTLYGLEYAGREVENLANLITNTTKLLNEEFARETSYLMNRYNIVHLATHAAFVPGDVRQSFILFGDGSQVSLEDVSGWNLPNVDLVVLSACETGLGDELGDGREILGLGYQMQKAGASASISSLWSVSDGGTRVLMDEFYAALRTGSSKAEALQQAQIALINGNFSNVGTERGDDGRIVAVSTETGLPASVSENLDHPYYWAPFILIGNGL